jgi:hypothetical protein
MLCAFIKVSAWLTVKCFEIATFAKPETVMGKFVKDIAVKCKLTTYERQKYWLRQETT